MVHSIQHYVRKFVGDLLQVGGFLPDILSSSTKKTDHHDVVEILLKAVLNNLILTTCSYISRGKV